MATLLGFPLAQPLGGNLTDDVRIRKFNDRQWRLNWTSIVAVGDDGFMIALDGKHYATIAHGPPVDVRLETVLGAFTPKPIFQVAQIPRESADPGFFIPGYFDALIPNRIKFTFAPPASVVDLDKYNVYWDKGDGTVEFTLAKRLAVVKEDGSASYEAITPALVTGTYKFVVRAVDKEGNETTNTAATSLAITTLPGEVTGFALSYSDSTKKATLTWVDPADIGGGTVDIFTNGGDVTKPFADYNTSISSIAAGVQTFVSGVLAEGLHVFGIRVTNATGQEPNTSVIVSVRLDSSADEIGNPPPKPFLEAEPAEAGKVILTAYALPLGADGVPTQAKFFTNDGAGGAVDFNTPLDTISMIGVGHFRAALFKTVVYGETARKFAAQTVTAAGSVSLNSDEVTVTPDATAPSVPLTPAASTGRF